MIEKGVRTALLADAAVQAAVLGRIFPGMAPQGEGFPRLTYQRIATRRRWDMGGPSGLASVRLEVSAWARTEAEARSISTAVRNVLDGFVGPMDGDAVQLIQMIDEGEQTEPPGGGGDMPIYRSRMDFLIHHEENRPNR